MKVTKRGYILLLAGVTFVSMAAFLAYSSVDDSLSVEDKDYIPKYLVAVKRLAGDPSYADELDYIVSVQRSVLQVAPSTCDLCGLPFYQKREPKELYLARTGLCYDRSRVIEKIFVYSGLKFRHVSIFSTKDTGSALSSFFTPDVPSHAVTEVLTKKGWLVVDSNEQFVSVDKGGMPISIQKLQLALNNHASIQWKKEPKAGIYKQRFTFLYGLYSRHGKFYPPYNMIPDINYRELIQNVI